MSSHIIESGRELSGSTPIVFLVHGFGNSRKSARKSYEVLLRRMSSTDDRLDHNHTCCFIYWPGNFRLHKPLSLMSAYPRAIDHAIESAELLASFLVRKFVTATLPTSFTFIAHSLGCRLVLELMNIFATQYGGNRVANGLIRRSRLFLMGAAVPSAYFRLHRHFRRSIVNTGGECVLYSPIDLVLNGMFPIGQRLSGESASEAVGVNGAPRWVWKDGCRNFCIDHTEYWNSRKSASSANEYLGLRFSNEIEYSCVSERSVSEVNAVTSRSL